MYLNLSWRSFVLADRYRICKRVHVCHTLKGLNLKYLRSRKIISWIINENNESNLRPCELIKSNGNYIINMYLISMGRSAYDIRGLLAVASICVEYWETISSPLLMSPSVFMASVSEPKKIFKSQMIVGEF
jgi:hypothetical protein